MRGKFIRGMAAGALIGAAAGVMFIPQMDKRTRRRFQRAGRQIADFTSNVWDGITDIRK